MRINMEYFIMYLISVALVLLMLLGYNLRDLADGHEGSIIKQELPWLIPICFGWPMLLVFFIYLTYLYAEAED